VEAFIKFEEALKEVELLLQETGNAFYSAENNSPTPNEKEVHLFKANTFSRSGIILLCGHFEGFLKELLKEFLNQINNANIQPQFLPDSLLGDIIRIMLDRCGSSENHRQKLKDLISRNSCIEIDERMQQEFSKTWGNPTVDTIEKMLSRIGISDVIETLSVRDFDLTTHTQISQIDNNLKSSLRQIFSSRSFDNLTISEVELEILRVLEDKWKSRSKRRTVAYVRTIEQLLTQRNEIAHGNSDRKLTKQEFENSIREIRQLASGINELTQAQLETLCNNPN
jgi:hypothetical protein